MAQNPKEKSQILENQRFAICNVPGAGIEPARIAPLVFETSASTDSAIRAGVVRARGLSFGRIASGLEPGRRGWAFRLRNAKVSDFLENAKYLSWAWGQMCIFVGLM